MAATMMMSVPLLARTQCTWNAVLSSLLNTMSSKDVDAVFASVYCYKTPGSTKPNTAHGIRANGNLAT